MKARIYSTYMRGIHVFTMYFNYINVAQCLVRIDILKRSMAIVTSNIEKAYEILQEYRNTVIVCYKK
jgi:hypothetical protein